MIIAIIWFSAVIVGIAVGSSKGKGGLGFLVTLLLSWIGVIIIIAVPPNHDKLVEQGVEQKCPHCAEYVNAQAKVCKYCGKELAAEKVEEEKVKKEVKMMTCPKCKVSIEEGLSSCPNCGARLAVR